MRARLRAGEPKGTRSQIIVYAQGYNFAGGSSSWGRLEVMVGAEETEGLKLGEESADAGD